jgi:small subunit ribosomal protein S2
LNKTLASLDQAAEAMKGIVRSGRKVMFVATKKQAQEIVTEEARRLKMPYVTDRWLGGMLTNFATVRKSMKKLQTLEKMLKDETTSSNIAKRERLTMSRDKEKLDRVLGGIVDLTRLPAALFIVDVKREHIAVAEAKRLGIPVFAMCDTNSNPEVVDFPIPANDDAYKSIALITLAIGKAIEEGLMERKQDKDDQRLHEEEEAKRASDSRQAAAEGADVPPVATAAPAPVADKAPEETAPVAVADKAPEETAPVAVADEAKPE